MIPSVQIKFYVRLVIKLVFHLLADSRSVQLKNTKGNIQRRAGKALFNVHESLPGDWQTFTDNNIRLAEQVHSCQLAEQVNSSQETGRQSLITKFAWQSRYSTVHSYHNIRLISFLFST